MAIEKPAIMAIKNANGSYDVRLSFGWHPASDIAHGWICYIKSTDADTYCDPTDWDSAVQVKLSSQSLSYTIHAVSPTTRYSFALQAFFNASNGLALAEIVSYQTEELWDGIGEPPAPNLNDWIDFQPAAYVDFMAPITTAQLFEEGDDEDGSYVIIDLSVEDRNGEETTTQVRAARDFGTWRTINVNSGMIVLDPIDNSQSYVTAPAGTNIPVKIYRNRRDVILQYRSIGVLSGRTESTKEFVIDINQLPQITQYLVTLNFEGDADKRFIWWQGDDDVEYIKIYEMLDLDSDTEAPIQNPEDSTYQFPAQGKYEVTLPKVSSEKVYRLEPWGRGIGSEVARTQSQKVVVSRDIVDAQYGLVINFTSIDLSPETGIVLELQVKKFAEGVVVPEAEIKYTTTPLVPESWITLIADSEGIASTPQFSRPAPSFGDIIYYFQAENEDQISPIKEFKIDADNVPELYGVSFKFDGTSNLLFQATADDDVGGVKLEFATVDFLNPAFTGTSRPTVHLENKTGSFVYGVEAAPGETLHVRATAYSDFEAEEVSGVVGAVYYDVATRLGTKETEIYDLEKIAQDDTEATFQFKIGARVRLVNIYWQDNTYPDVNDFAGVIRITSEEDGNPYQFVVPLPAPGVDRHIYMEAIEIESGYVTDVERIIIKIQKTAPPNITLKSEVLPNGLLGLRAQIRSLHEAYPITITAAQYDKDLDSWVDKTPLVNDSFGLSDVGNYLVIIDASNEITLPASMEAVRVKVIATDSEGVQNEAIIEADRDKAPEAWVTKLDVSANPRIAINYDDDVKYVRLTTPSLGVKVWNELDFDWGGEGGFVEYVVGVTILNGNDGDGSDLESPFAPGEERAFYTIEVGDNETSPVLVAKLALQGEIGFGGTFDLDRDADLTVNLIYLPGAALAGRYAVSTTTFPDEAAVLAGPLTVFSEDGLVVEDVYTYTEGVAEKLYAAVKYYFEDDASDSGSYLIYDTDYYDPSDSTNVFLRFEKYDTGSVLTDGIRVTVSSSADNVALYYRTYNAGSTSAPAFTRTPTSGYAEDPYTFDIAVTRPTAIDAPDKILEVYGTDENGQVTSSQMIIIDRGLEPNLRSFVVRRNPDKSVVADWVGDSDTGSVRVLTSQSSMPADPTSGTGTPYNGTSVSGQTILVGADPAQPVYWAVTPFYNTGGSGTAGKALKGTLPAVSKVPVVGVLTSQVGSTGTLTLSIYDPYSFVNATSFEESEVGDYAFNADPTEWTGYDAVPALALSHNVELGAKHDVYVAWAVRYNDGFGNVWIKGVVPFDPDLIPEITGSASYNTSGKAVFTYKGDEDVKSIKYLTSKVGYPTAEDVIVEEDFVNGQYGNVTTELTLSIDEIGYITVVPFNLVDGEGNVGEALRVQTHPFAVTIGGNVVQVLSSQWVIADVANDVPWEGEGSSDTGNLRAYYELNLSPGGATQSMHVSWRYTGNPGWEEEYDFELTTAVLHKLRDSTTTLKKFFVGDPIEIEITPYDDVDGTGNAGPSVSISTSPGTSSLTGTALVDRNNTLRTTDKLVIGPGLAVAADENLRPKISLDYTASTSNPSGTPKDGAIWLKYV